MATQTPARPSDKPPNPAIQRPDQDDGGQVVLERRTEKAKPPQMYQVVMLNDDYTPIP